LASLPLFAKQCNQGVMSIKIRQTCHIDIDGHLITLVIQSHKLAKRLRLRCDPFQKKVFLTHPEGASNKDINAFFDKAHAWLKQQVHTKYSRTEFKTGSTIPILGVNYLIQHRPGLKPNVWLNDAILTVEGDNNRIQLILGKWLRFHALGILKKKSHEMADKIGVAVHRVKVRELKSLWGSCAADGSLTYSWRLIMAPIFVLDYICAHEVSHIKERNHGPRFWQLVESICPNYKIAKLWLRNEGKVLFQYG
jgi:predicted metal-dependent hydrolase